MRTAAGQNRYHPLRRTSRGILTSLALVALAVAPASAASATAEEPSPLPAPPGNELRLEAADLQTDQVLGVPEPEAAKAQALPLALEGGAAVDLDVPAEEALRQAPAEPQVRDLAAPAAAQPAALPAEAVTFGKEGGSASTLVLYDTPQESPYQFLSEYYATEMGVLASHSGRVTVMPVSKYVAGLAGSYTGVIYTGSTYDEPLPRAFVDDVLTGNVPVLWIGFNIWRLAATDTDRAAFTGRYGWDAATSYIDSADTVTTVRYEGQDLARHKLNKAGIVAPHVVKPETVQVLGTAQCSSSEGVAQDCAPIAQTTGSTFPWAVRSGNLTYIGEIPLAYMGEKDRYLALADLVLELVDPQAQTSRTAAVRLEDVSPDTDPDELQASIDVMVSRGVPFQIALVPVYTDPNGYYNDGQPRRLTLADTPRLVEVLKYAVDHGGTLIQHGTTHQYGQLTNPYSGTSTDDFEFIRSWCTAVPDPKAPQVACTKDTFVQIGGRLPEDSQEWAAQRVAEGRQIIAEVGLPVPTVFETPHYAASDASYRGMAQHYGTRYERGLFHAGLLTGRQGGDRDYIGQFFPYTVTDPYGTYVLPENLGNYEPETFSQHPARMPADIIAAARANKVVTHANASFFFHPYYDAAVLAEIIDGIKAEGYTFVPATQLR
ncbi:DUF2334 domain-containing protein [Actinomyces weissii]|uniref:DUF2334 domain-containing protein n=1 Tax=Actinomyces weissii TaxID=675090 RepID=UPI001F35A3A4|nr:polysaccharide deacetylase family protein [Actinomyces weissii]